MLIGRHDIEKLMRLDPASACLPNELGQSNVRNIASDAESIEVESELSELLLNLRPIKQVHTCLVMISPLLFQFFLSKFSSYLLFSLPEN